ncbi:MAG TPA: endolytic transglycosylase MltG, partial [Desulfobacterales bacterium]|nr:endolytic transglycosylase MltG [Desulfobacterales bacterium]
LDLSPYEVLILASMVEKETAKAIERPLIAGVFLNRLKKGMRMQSDPTVVYGVENYSGKITRTHLRTPTPYNTYTLKRLPIGPISNPGKAALMAVLQPTESKFYYFVSQNDGSHKFSKTLREHNRAVNKYQRVKKKQATENSG